LFQRRVLVTKDAIKLELIDLDGSINGLENLLYTEFFFNKKVDFIYVNESTELRTS